MLGIAGIAGNGQRELMEVLSGEVLAELMQGEIARWDDARIAALNPGDSTTDSFKIAIENYPLGFFIRNSSNISHH